MSVHEGPVHGTRIIRWRLILGIGLPVLAIIAVVAGLLASTGGGGGTKEPAAVPSTRYHVVWSDEFNGASLSSRNWLIENDSTYGDGNNELACLKDRPENLQLQGGMLYIRARRESPPLVCNAHDDRFPAGRTYTSAMISTKGKRAWHGGLFEVRAKLPTAPGASRGLWPAFWMRPEVPGPNSGEIDIFEAIGTSPGKTTGAEAVHQTFWAKGIPRGRTTTTVPVDKGGPAEGFHTYGVRWESNRLTWLVDGKVTFSCDTKSVPELAGAMAGKFYMRLNLAVGGNWPGAPQASTKLPAAMTIDWVRVSEPGRA